MEIKYSVTQNSPLEILDAITCIPNLEKQLNKLEAEIKKQAKQLRRKGIEPVLCQQYLDSLVDEFIVCKMNQLEQQQLANKSAIEMAYVQRGVDKTKTEELLMHIEEQITITETELAYVEKLYKEYHSLQDKLLGLYDEKTGKGKKHE